MDGFFVIPVADLPAGLLTQYSGKFMLQVYQLYAACNPEKFRVAGVFDCIEFEITGGTFEKNNLGCSFDCNGASVNSALVPFTDETEVVIDWSLYSGSFGNSPTISVYHEVTPDVFQLVAVTVEQTRVDGVLTSITIDNGGVQTGVCDNFGVTCCNTIEQTFVNATSTTIPYTGNKPTVTVAYLIDGVWQAAGVATPITITDSEVVVDHGGINSTGVIKLVQ